MARKIGLSIHTHIIFKTVVHKVASKQYNNIYKFQLGLSFVKQGTVRLSTITKKKTNFITMRNALILYVNYFRNNLFQDV